jgi:hypothetical protein
MFLISVEYILIQAQIAINLIMNLQCWLVPFLARQDLRAMAQLGDWSVGRAPPEHAAAPTDVGTLAFHFASL